VSGTVFLLRKAIEYHLPLREYVATGVFHMRLEAPLHVQLLRVYVVWWRVRRYYYEVTMFIGNVDNRSTETGIVNDLHRM
jgi:hypothetical protein